MISMPFLTKYKKTISIAVALLTWQAIAMILHNDILLVGPFVVFRRLLELIPTAMFWLAILESTLRILCGLLLAVVLGLFFAALASRYSFVNSLLWPYMAAMKSTPVASFIIICLVWVSTKNLSLLTAFLICFPIVYANMLEGFSSIDTKMEQMLTVYRIPFVRRLRCLYIPHVMPFFLSTLKISVGMAFKSGIAAEVIGLPQGTIGSFLYDAKIYLSTADMFAWTATIILVSMLLEKCIVFLVQKSYQSLVHTRRQA